jgi:hypothetical protein
MSKFNFFNQKKLKFIWIFDMFATMIVCLMRIFRFDESIIFVFKTCVL